jgi:hypothetical protein
MSGLLHQTTQTPSFHRDFVSRLGDLGVNKVRHVVRRDLLASNFPELSGMYAITSKNIVASMYAFVSKLRV